MGGPLLDGALDSAIDQTGDWAGQYGPPQCKVELFGVFPRVWANHYLTLPSNGFTVNIEN